MRNQRFAAIAAVAATTLGMAACGPGDREPGSLQHLDFSLAEEYSSIDALDADASLVVRGTARDIDRIEYEGVPYQLVTVSVSEVVKGEAPSGDIVVRQLYGLVDGLAAPMTTDQEYFLFLRPFEFKAGEDTGQWYVVGPAQWTFKDGRLVLPVDKAYLGEIPSTLSQSQIEIELER